MSGWTYQKANDPSRFTTPPTAESEGAFTRGLSYHAQTNASGTSNIQPDSDKALHTEKITVSGGATTRTIVLKTTGRIAGDKLALRLEVPATAGIVIEVRNATALGDILTQLTTDTEGTPCALEYVYNGSAWEKYLANYPA